MYLKGGEQGEPQELISEKRPKNTIKLKKHLAYSLGW